MPCVSFCAADYKNEKEVGVALAEGMKMGLAKREELFITTKVCCFLSNFFGDVLALYFDMAFQHMYLYFVCCSLIFTQFPSQLWNSDHGHVKEACKDSLKNLQLEYLDLYLVHFPVATRHTGM